MTKEVIAAIRGLHFSNDEDGDKIETITPAAYYCRGDSHYLIYEELDENSGKSTRNMIKYNRQRMELTKKGLVNMHMIFEEQKKNVTSYATPFGTFMIGIDTTKVNVEEQDEKMILSVEYALDINYEQLSNCKINIEIIPKEAGIGLMS